MRTLILSLACAGLTILANHSHVQAQESWGHLTGRIVVQGTVPSPEELTIDTNDRQYCLSRGERFTDRSLLVGDAGGLQHAYVMMYFARGDNNRPAIHPSYEEAKKQSVVLNNEECRFQPRAIFVRPGQTLEFQNSDTIGHNCHVVTMKNEENISLGAGQSVELSLDNADRVPGIVKCDVHPWMEALLLVRDEPYVAITDSDGRFRIENIPAGEWTFQFWHTRTGFLKSLAQEGEKVAGRRGEMKVVITADETLDLGELTIAVDDLLK